MTLMTKRVRRLLFIAFVAGFALAAPLVVLYTAGYRYHFATGKIVQTGALSISSIPKGASISLDGLPRSERTPAVIDNVLTGEHVLRIEKDGFYTWEKQLSVTSRETTFVKDAVLFLDEAPSLEAAGEVRRVGQDPTGRQVAYLATDGGWTELWVSDLSSREKTLLFRLPAETSKGDALSWSADGNAVLIATGSDPAVTRSVIRIRDGVRTPVEKLVPKADDAWWDTTRGDRLFVKAGDKTVAYDLSLGRATLLPDGTEAARTAGGRFIIAQRIGDQVVVSRTQGDHSSIIAYLPPGTYRFRSAPRDGLILLEDAVRERLILLDGNGGDQPILLHASASYWQWEPGGGRLLMSDGFDLSIYSPSSHAQETVTRFSAPITGLNWHPGSNVILFTQESRLSSIDLDRRDGHHVIHLVSGSGLNGIAVDGRGKRAFFFGTVDGAEGLFIRRLVP